MVLSFVTKWFERKVKIINISSIVEYVWNTNAFKVRQEMDVYAHKDTICGKFLLLLYRGTFVIVTWKDSINEYSLCRKSFDLNMKIDKIWSLIITEWIILGIGYLKGRNIPISLKELKIHKILNKFIFLGKISCKSFLYNTICQKWKLYIINKIIFIDL